MGFFEDFVGKYATAQNIIIVALIIVLIVMWRRENASTSKTKTSETPPSADTLLESLAQSGAVAK